MLYAVCSQWNASVVYVIFSMLYNENRKINKNDTTSFSLVSHFCFLLEKWKKQFVCVFSRELKIHRLIFFVDEMFALLKIVSSKSIRVVHFIVKLFFVLPFMCKSIFHSI